MLLLSPNEPLQIYHDTSHNCLVYRTRNPSYILDHVAQAKAVGSDHVAVPINLFNMQLCRRLALPVAPVITTDNYDWPINPMYKPLAHQKLMTNFHVLHPYSFNLSDMGAMKTLSTLWACDWLMRQNPAGTCRALIVAKLSTLTRTWADAIFLNFLNRRTCEVLHGSEDKRRKKLATPADFYIVNYDGLKVGAHTRGKFGLSGFAKDLADRKDIRICIIDEASAYRDATSGRHRLARAICKRDFLWLLTGTPTPQGPPDAYGLARLVNDAFGESYTSFFNRTMVQLAQYTYVPSRDGYEQARRLLTPSIRIDIKEVWDGPPLTTQQRDVPLSPKQKHFIDDLVASLAVQLSQGVTITPANEAAVRTKLLQAAQGAVYDDDHKAHLTDAAPRLRELDWVIENANGKIIIFCPFTSIVQLVYDHLRIPAAIINGATPVKQRDEIIRQFQQEDTPRALVADPGCISQGLDLWRAQTVVWYGPTDKCELYIQGNKRAHRPGQKYPVTIVQLVSTQTERDIFHRIERNERAQGVLLDNVRKGVI
jgi:SNF2 family DNA or RNA helicase